MAQGPMAPVPLRQRGIPVGAILLIALGVLLLLQTTGVVRWELWLDLWRFWPVIIIAIGINTLVGRRVPWLALVLVVGLMAGSVGIAFALGGPGVDRQAISSFTQPLDGVESVDVGITFGAGQLTVGSLPAASPNLVEGRFQGREARASFNRSGGTGDLRLSMRGHRSFRHVRSVEWEILLSRSPSLSIELDGGAADITVDLRELQVGYLDVDAGAAQVEIIMPDSAGHVDAEIDAGAADIEVIVPDGVAAKITSNSGLSSIDIDGSRFPNAGGAHVSPDFDTAENRVAIHLRVGASSVRVR